MNFSHDSGVQYVDIYILEIAVTLVQDKHVEGSQGPLEGHRISIFKFDPFSNRHASMQAAKEDVAIKSDIQSVLNSCMLRIHQKVPAC